MRNKIMLDEGMKDVTFTEEESNNCSPGQEQYARCKNRNSTHKTHLLRRDDGQRGEPRIPYTVASLTGWVDGKSKGEWGDGVAGKGAVREGIKQARQAEEGGTKLQRRPFGAGIPCLEGDGRSSSSGRHLKRCAGKNALAGTERRP